MVRVIARDRARCEKAFADSSDMPNARLHTE